MNKYTISVLVENHFGVLSRISGLFSGRGYNILSLTVSETHEPGISKMTIVTSGDEAIIEQIDKQLNKLVEVIKVTNLTGSEFIEREMALIKITADSDTRTDVVQLAEMFDGKIVTVQHNELGIELSGRPDKIDDFISLVKDFGIIDVARSGRVAIAKKSGGSA